MASAHKLITVQVKLHPDVQVLADEWSGISDPVKRRKLQNRLNKRAERRRQAVRQQPEEVGFTAADFTPDEATIARINRYAGLSTVITRIHGLGTNVKEMQGDVLLENSADSIAEAAKADRLAILMVQRRRDLVHFESRVLPQIDPNAPCPLPADHLLSLVYYNVHRALVANVAMLNLDVMRTCEDVYVSPFFGAEGVGVDATFIASLPANFRPTFLQTQIPHHAQWDIFPDPVLRDNVLLYGEDNVDDVELALDLLGESSFASPEEDTQSRTGMIVWGVPWDVMSWEVTERFARKYPWFLVGAERLLMSTNEWRRRRGAAPMRFEW